MKALIALIALALATPAAAADFTGPRIEVSASVDDVTKARDTSDVGYSAAVGFDIPLGDKLTAGLEANSDNAFDSDRTIGAAARLGYIVNDNLLIFGKAGYENYNQVRSKSLDGLRLGGGVEVNVSSNSYVKLEGRYTDFERGAGRYGALLGFGLRF